MGIIQMTFNSIWPTSNSRSQQMYVTHWLQSSVSGYCCEMSFGKCTSLESIMGMALRCLLPGN